MDLKMDDLLIVDRALQEYMGNITFSTSMRFAKSAKSKFEKEILKRLEEKHGKGNERSDDTRDK